MGLSECVEKGGGACEAWCEAVSRSWGGVGTKEICIEKNLFRAQNTSPA